MTVAIQDNGTATIRIGARDWAKAICLLVVLAYGHAELQWRKVDGVAASLKSVTERLVATETTLKASVADQVELRREFQATASELRGGIRNLNEYLRDQAHGP